MIRSIIGIALFLALVWGVLYLSGKGVLVRQQQLDDHLRCSYFIATGIDERTFTLATHDVREGRTGCPKIIESPRR